MAPVAPTREPDRRGAALPRGRRARLRRWAARCRDDRGGSSAEMVIMVPLLFTLVLLIAQVVVWGHATHTAQAAAAHALAATRVEDGTVQAGRADAQQVLDQLGRGPLHGVRVDVTRGADRATVRVRGTASSVVPFLHLPVSAEVAGPVERFRSAGRAAP